MKRHRYWPSTGSRWWSVCALAVFTLLFITLLEVAYLLVHGQWMPWR